MGFGTMLKKICSFKIWKTHCFALYKKYFQRIRLANHDENFKSQLKILILKIDLILQQVDDNERLLWFYAATIKLMKQVDFEGSNIMI
jgi:hypothetical protein